MLAFGFLALALTFASATPVFDTLVLHERRAAAPEGFVATGLAPAEQTLQLKLNLAQNNLAGLEAQLLAAATPGSATYGQWLSKDEVDSFSAPTAETTAAVSEWLSSHGLTSTTLSPSGDWISVTVPVSKANELLAANYHVFTHTSSGTESIRTLEYSIPAALKDHIRVVTPTTSFSGPRPLPPVISVGNPKPQSHVVPVSDAVPASCKNTMTPTCLQAMYAIPTTPATSKAGSIGVAGFGDQFANKADLTQFLKAQRPDISSTTSFGLTSVDGGTNSQSLSQAGVEANLDIQYTVGLATGVPVTFVSVGTTNKDGADGGFLDIITALIAESAPPQVLTTSYGFDTEASLSKPLTTAMCNSYMQLTARGVSILFATGDGGVASTPGVSCSGRAFPPTFPTCPYATLVGATAGTPETGASLSAGGFSNYFPTQSWQQTAVSAYIKSIGTQYAGKYNTTGRGYPDVSAIGQSVSIVASGSTGLVDGTSCSSPIFASVIGLLNDRLLAAGKPVLGFLNPWLYANPQMFNDITSGTNPGCGTNGFSAKAGWDPVTGLGSPNFPAMLKAAGL
ncbi:unnamed protein product [Mycena citricolor]|uniref:Peptidase S53 domain-containing protein n=1 Tax=Mycena citricolor TaxID=2018698 RepID=A0AAD2H8I8_9AGAR|nr:unnamed protein product [Mycena citricolor]CAK5271625.1 unnamed protein product [Mycena citricolor]